MLHAYTARFDVTENLKKFFVFVFWGQALVALVQNNVWMLEWHSLWMEGVEAYSHKEKTLQH
jgi:hypothetical protein